MRDEARMNPIQPFMQSAVDRLPVNLWIKILRPIDLQLFELNEVGNGIRSLYVACQQNELWHSFLRAPRADIMLL